MPWPRRTPAAVQLKRDNDALALQLVRLREQLTNKERYAAKLELLLRERLARIDQLVAQVEQLRLKNKQLDAEAEQLAQTVPALRPRQGHAG
jgi:septal ring factor EnvC (AmiA/AmiB activator)